MLSCEIFYKINYRALRLNKGKIVCSTIDYYKHYKVVIWFYVVNQRKEGVCDYIVAFKVCTVPAKYTPEYIRPSWERTENTGLFPPKQLKAE